MGGGGGWGGVESVAASARIRVELTAGTNTMISIGEQICIVGCSPSSSRMSPVDFCRATNLEHRSPACYHCLTMPMCSIKLEIFSDVTSIQGRNLTVYVA